MGIKNINSNANATKLSKEQTVTKLVLNHITKNAEQAEIVGYMCTNQEANALINRLTDLPAEWAPKYVDFCMKKIETFYSRYNAALTKAGIGSDLLPLVNYSAIKKDAQANTELKNDYIPNNKIHRAANLLLRVIARERPDLMKDVYYRFWGESGLGYSMDQMNWLWDNVYTAKFFEGKLGNATDRDVRLIIIGIINDGIFDAKVKANNKKETDKALLKMPSRTTQPVQPKQPERTIKPAIPPQPVTKKFIIPKEAAKQAERTIKPAIPPQPVTKKFITPKEAAKQAEAAAEKARSEAEKALQELQAANEADRAKAAKAAEMAIAKAKAAAQKAAAAIAQTNNRPTQTNISVTAPTNAPPITGNVSVDGGTKKISSEKMLTYLSLAAILFKFLK